MRAPTALLLLLLLIPNSAYTTTTGVLTLNNIIAQSDQIFIAKITSGKCLNKECSPQPHSAPKEYTFSCIKPLLDKCPKISSFRSPYELKVGSSYLLLSPIDDDGKVFSPIELRENNTRVVFSGYYRGLYNATLYKSKPGFESVPDYYYYSLKDVIAAIRK